MTGKVAWIAENVRPDLCFTALSMSKKTNCATIADLKRLDKVIAKVKDNPAKVTFQKLLSRINFKFWVLVMLPTNVMTRVLVETLFFLEICKMRNVPQCSGNRNKFLEQLIPLRTQKPLICLSLWMILFLWQGR